MCPAVTACRREHCAGRFAFPQCVEVPHSARSTVPPSERVPIILGPSGFVYGTLVLACLFYPPPPTNIPPGGRSEPALGLHAPENGLSSFHLSVALFNRSTAPLRASGRL